MNHARPARGGRWRGGLAPAGLALAALALAAGCASGPPAAPQPAGPALAGYWTRSRLLDARPWRGLRFQPAPSPSAHTALRVLRVGALFFREPGGNHFCTASVVTSPYRDLLITAAHCINGGRNGGYRRDIVFIPDYRDGTAPFGVWDVARLLVAPGWGRDSAPSLDVGFVVLRPHDGRNIEDILGANRLGADSRYRYLVRVTGYPDSAQQPIACLNWTSRQSATQLRFECGGYTGGTSGSPWVTRFDPLTRTGVVVGVIGGYQEGGSTAAVSYSPFLGTQVQRLYRQAEAVRP